MVNVGDAYAVHTGSYAGEILMFVKGDKHTMNFIAFPVMENRTIPTKSFDHAKKTGIIKYVERLPEFVRNVAVEQFKVNEKSNHRWKQPNSQNILDSKD